MADDKEQFRRLIPKGNGGRISSPGHECNSSAAGEVGVCGTAFFLDFAPPEARAINIEAICAFITLRDQAKPALPQLQTLMESTNSDIALHAMLASCGTGSNAIPLLLNGLTNQFADVRNEAANYVTQNFSNQFLGRRDQVIPLFVKLLNDSYNDVRMNATNELKQIDAAAALKAGVK